MTIVLQTKRFVTSTPDAQAHTYCLAQASCPKSHLNAGALSAGNNACRQNQYSPCMYTCVLMACLGPGPWPALSTYGFQKCRRNCSMSPGLPHPCHYAIHALLYDCSAAKVHWQSAAALCLEGIQDLLKLALGFPPLLFIGTDNEDVGLVALSRARR